MPPLAFSSEPYAERIGETEMGRIGDGKIKLLFLWLPDSPIPRFPDSVLLS
jgi:hypothetical protein